MTTKEDSTVKRPLGAFAAQHPQQIRSTAQRESRQRPEIRVHGEEEFNGYEYHPE